MDYVAASVASPAKYTDRFAVATPSERRRNRHDVWRLIIESGLNTYREVAEDYGVSVQAVRYGVEQSYARRRRLAEAM